MEEDQVLILRMRAVNAIDASAMNSLEELEQNCTKKGIRLILSHVNEQPLKIMKKSSFYSTLGKDNFCAHIDDALKRAEELLKENQ